MVYEAEENYCSFFPEKMFGVNYNYGCYLHDRQYRNEVKIRKTRFLADRDLKNNVYNSFKLKNKKIIGKFISIIMFIGVRLFGIFSWTKEN